jgi:hypothetical protein
MMWRDGVENMQTEERYDDLTDLFETQDAVLQSDGFVADVMDQIPRRARWRAPLLFGAGGIGVGAALSQIGGLTDLIKLRAPDLTVSFSGVATSQVHLETPSLWIGLAAIIVLGCAALVMSEKA